MYRLINPIKLLIILIKLYIASLNMESEDVKFQLINFMKKIITDIKHITFCKLKFNLIDFKLFILFIMMNNKFVQL